MKRFLYAWLILLPARCLLAQSIGYGDVKGIFITKCATCHRPGEAAPFALLTYADIARRAAFIKKVIGSNYMPPWRADIHYRDFANDRRLTAKEKDMIMQWIDAGAPRGSGSDASAGGRGGNDAGVGSGGDDRMGLLAGTAYNRPPDLSLRIDSSFLVPGDNAERFIVFKLPYELPEGENIEAVEFYCNNKKLIHHINYGFYDVPDTAVDIRGGSRYLDVSIPGPALNEYNRLKKNFTYYTGWVPGATAESYPPGFGWVLPKRGVVLLTAHYVALGADERSIVGVNLFFTKKPILRPVRIISLGSSGIGEDAISPPLLIRAGRVDSFSLKVKTPKDQSILYVWPHMHYIGKEIRAFAVTPGGDTIPLVHIPDWDFRWQELYRMKNLVKIPAGSVVHLIGVYDNTAGNPANPNSPPRMIFSTGNMESNNEMLTLILIYVNSEEGDEKIGL